jgi:hypothetical protein
VSTAAQRRWVAFEQHVLHELAEIREQLAILTARGRPRDASEERIVSALVRAFEDQPVTAAAVLRHARADPALAAALLEADITTGRELGQALRRLENRPIAGLVLRRVDTDREGVVWCVRVVNSQTRAGAD